MSKIISAFEDQVDSRSKKGSHRHRSSLDDELIISSDLRSLRPFMKTDGRSFEMFHGISNNPVHDFDKNKFVDWANRRKRNILMYYPSLDCL